MSGNNSNLLIYASGKGYLQDCISALAQGISVTSTDNLGNTALHLAAGAGHRAIIELLLKQKGINIDAKNNQGDTPLHKAAWRSEIDAIKLLLQAGAKQDIKNKQDKTPSDLTKSKEVEALFDVELKVGDDDEDE